MQSDVQISDVRLALAPRPGRVPFEPQIESLNLALSSTAFLKIVQQGVKMAAGRAPVDVELSSARLVDGGAEIVTKVKRSILKADLRVRLAFESTGGETIRVRIAELDAPAWIPSSFVLDQAMGMAAGKPGLARVAGDDRAIDVDPAAILASRGIPASFAKPGVWSVDPKAEAVGVSYAPAG
jgi:hypothetical protein